MVLAIHEPIKTTKPAFSVDLSNPVDQVAKLSYPMPKKSSALTISPL